MVNVSFVVFLGFDSQLFGSIRVVFFSFRKLHFVIAVQWSSMHEWWIMSRDGWRYQLQVQVFGWILRWSFWCLCVFDFASFSVFINIALGFEFSFLLSSHFKIKVTADNYYFEGIWFLSDHDMMQFERSLNVWYYLHLTVIWLVFWTAFPALCSLMLPFVAIFGYWKQMFLFLLIMDRLNSNPFSEDFNFLLLCFCPILTQQ